VRGLVLAGRQMLAGRSAGFIRVQWA
jgi:hypothetical protein